MNHDRVNQLLDGGSDAACACRSALDEGAELILWDGSAPADRMLAAYRRRHARVTADAVESIGFAKALADLEAAGTSELKLGQVTADEPAYTYMLFLTREPASLVACVGIARA
jgi:hypothetical protein